MSKRTVVKLGSSIVAGQSGELRHGALERICAALASVHAEGGEVVIVTSGAIARGAAEMGLGRRPVAIEELQAASAVGQGRLYRVYEELLQSSGARSAQVLLTFADISQRAHYLNARGTLRKLLDWGVVPVINENDTTATDEITFGDNDFLAAQVAVLLSADLLLLLTDIDGLYTADPRRDPAARLLSEVTDFDALREIEVGHTTSPLGSGGMRSKVIAADMATAAGIRTVICNGLDGDALRNALGGRPAGTSFPPRKTRHSSFKLWLRYAKPTRGRVEVDSGAATALREGGTSLLPVGVVEVSGDFEAGDAVEIVERDRSAGAGGRLRPVSKGICNYAARDLRQIAGMKTAAVRELMPDAVQEAVHRDYMVLD